MITLREREPLRKVIGEVRSSGKTISLVPTMGALHEGHLSLVRLARAESNFVVVSIFVNPLQFAPGEDFERYPRQLDKDVTLLEAAGVDSVFAPAAGDFYPPDFSTSLEVANVSEGGEGAERPSHFRGVATVVAKLLLQTTPDIACFGRKDLQQVAVIRRLIRDLDFPVRLIVGETMRESDGLAISSRNVYLTAAERERAAAFPRALFAARDSVARGQRDSGTLERETRADLARAGLEADYVEVVDSLTMRHPPKIGPGAALAAAIRIGKTRLIDNVMLLQE